MKITSKQNKTYKLWVKLKQKKYRDKHNLFLVFGQHLIDKAKEYNMIVEILTSNEKKEGTFLSRELLEELQMTQTYIDQVAVCRKESAEIKSNKVLMIDDIQDPDNLGALIRSAAAFGFHHVIVSLKSADIYNEKTIRASKGAIFDVYIEKKPLSKGISALKEKGYCFYFADAHNKGTNELSGKVAIVLGNEGRGVTPEIKDLCDGSIHIITQNVESLNVSVAGGIIMHRYSEI